MKLYSKNGKLHRNAHKLNDKDAYASSHYDVLNKTVERGFDMKNFLARRHVWFDIDVAGKNYFNMPVIFKVKK